MSRARAVAVDVDKDLPPRHMPLAADAMAQVFGGCVQQGGACNSPQDCCQVPGLPLGVYVLCYFYRSARINVGYCTKSSVAYGS